MGFFDKLKQGLGKTRESLNEKINGVFSSFRKVDEELLENLEEVLIMSDIGVDTSFSIIQKLREKIKKENITEEQAVKDSLKQIMKEKGMTTVNFLKAFPRKKRLEIVDILRGNIPIPIDYKELSMIAKVLGIEKDDIYEIWEKRMKQVLETSGMNIYSNAALVNAMFDCAKRFIDLQ